MCDYDVFPLRDFRTLAIPDRFWTYSAVGMTMASGSAVSWENTLDAILEEARRNVQNNSSTSTSKLNVWSDLSSSYEILRRGILPRPQRQIMPGHLLLPPEGWSREYCQKRQFRKHYLVVHMNIDSLVSTEGAVLETHELLQPQHRASVARRAVPNFEIHCGIRVVDHKNSTTTSS